MQNRKIDFRKIFIPSDSIAIIVILVGLLIAIFLSDLAVRLIGISVSILGSVALFMQVSQRISEMVSMRHMPKSPTKNYRITKRKDQKATRSVIENFDTTFDPEEGASVEKDQKRTDRKEYKSKPQQEKSDIPTKETIEEKTTESTETKPGLTKEHAARSAADHMGSDEGFRVIKKSEKKQTEQKSETPSAKTAPQPSTQEKKQEEQKSAEEKKGKEQAAEEQKEKEKSDTKKVKLRFTDESVEQAGGVKKKEIKPQVSEEEAKPGEDTTQKENRQEISKPTFEKKEPEPLKAEAKISEKKPENHSKPQQSFVSKTLDSQLMALMEDMPSMGRHSGKEFEYYMNRVLMSIRSVSNTRTAAFVLVNPDKNELKMAYFATDVKRALNDNKRYSIGKDVISRIYINKKPEILSEINPAAEMDLIPYYSKSLGTQSFIGIPVFYEGSVIGVLCCDSNIPDVYDSVTVDFLGHLTKLISGLLMSYTEKYDLVQESRTLEAIRHFRSQVSDKTESLINIMDSLVNTAELLIENSTTGICCYDEELHGWHIISSNIKHDGKDNKPIAVDIDNSIIGDSIVSNETIFIAPVEGKNVRVYPDEQGLAGGFFVAVPVPLKTVGSNFGALFVEGRNLSGISDYDISMLETLCEQAGSSIEKIHFIEMLDSGALIDDSTGLFNPQAFYLRLQEEFIRSADFNFPLSLCLFRIDKYAALDPDKYSGRMEQVVFHTVDIVKKSLKSYDIFGRIDSGTFAILLIGKQSQEAKIWAERLRQEVAISVMDIDSQQFTVTISIGISGAESSSSVEELIGNTKKMLKKSSEKSNSVSVFS